MPSFQDSAVIFIIALLLFGPKKLPELARQLGKLMGEFRRASNDFRMQMEDELRLAEQKDREKEIAAMQAAAPVVPVIEATPAEDPQVSAVEAQTEALPIASSGELEMMPPSTGLPMARGAAAVEGASALTPLLEAIPEAEPEIPEHTIHTPVETEARQVDHHG